MSYQIAIACIQVNPCRDCSENNRFKQVIKLFINYTSHLIEEGLEDNADDILHSGNPQLNLQQCLKIGIL